MPDPQQRPDRRAAPVSGQGSAPRHLEATCPSPQPTYDAAGDRDPPPAHRPRGRWPALAVAAVAVPVFAVIGNDSPRSDKDNLADDKTHPALAESDLLRDADTEYDREDYTLFRTSETFAGDGQALYLPCQRDAISSLGATSSFTRVFDAFTNPDRLTPATHRPRTRPRTTSWS